MTVYHGTDFLLNFFGVHNYLRATVAEHQSTAHWWFYIAMYFAGFSLGAFSCFPLFSENGKNTDFLLLGRIRQHSSFWFGE